MKIIRQKNIMSVSTPPSHFVTPILFMLAAMSAIPSTPAASGPAAEELAEAFVARHEQAIRPLEHAVNLAWWNANTSGKDEDFKAKEEAQNKLEAVLATPARFEELKKLQRGKIKNAV